MEKPQETGAIYVNVTLAGRPYPLQVKASEEALIRKLVYDINEKVNSFQQTYPGKDKQDCLALVALVYAVENQKAQQQSAANLHPELDRIDTLLTRLLSS